MGDDFLGAFGVIQRGERTLLVGNDRWIDGRLQRTWDLPGGRIERGELALEALRREIAEETGLVVCGTPRFLLVQEGERCQAGQRQHAWRSFFFAVEVQPGEPQPGHEVQAIRWMSPAEMAAELLAPYHDSFRRYLSEGGQWFQSRWVDRE